MNNDHEDFANPYHDARGRFASGGGGGKGGGMAAANKSLLDQVANAGSVGKGTPGTLGHVKSLIKSTAFEFTTKQSLAGFVNRAKYSMMAVQGQGRFFAVTPADHGRLLKAGYKSVNPFK